MGLLVPLHDRGHANDLWIAASRPAVAVSLVVGPWTVRRYDSSTRRT
jgi:hypothetical protein